MRSTPASGIAGTPRPWSEAAAAWKALQRTPAVAYCRWREAEALIRQRKLPQRGRPRHLREAHAIALELGARPLLHELELLARRSRMDLTVPNLEHEPERQRLDDVLGLTPREVEVLDLIVSRLHQPGDRVSAGDQREDWPTSTSRTSCASSMRATGLRQRRSRTGSHHRVRGPDVNRDVAGRRGGSRRPADLVHPARRRWCRAARRRRPRRGRGGDVAARPPPGAAPRPPGALCL